MLEWSASVLKRGTRLVTAEVRATAPARGGSCGGGGGGNGGGAARRLVIVGTVTKSMRGTPAT